MSAVKWFILGFSVALSSWANGACKQLKISGFDSKIDLKTGRANTTVFSDQIKSAVVSTACEINSKSEAEILSDFSKLGKVQTLPGPIFRLESELAGVKTVNYLRPGKDLYYVSLLNSEKTNAKSAAQNENKVLNALQKL